MHFKMCRADRSEKAYTGWCASHGWKTDDPIAREEFGLACCEEDAYNDVDCVPDEDDAEIAALEQHLAELEAQGYDPQEAWEQWYYRMTS